MVVVVVDVAVEPGVWWESSSRSRGGDKSGVGVAGAGIDELDGPADAGECEDGAGGIREGGGRGR